MVVRTEDRLKVGDFIIFKSKPTMVFKVIIINYMDGKLSLKAVHPVAVKDPFQIVNVPLPITTKSGIEVLDPEKVRLLYD